MQITKIGRRYSKALFEAVLEKNALETVKKDIEIVLNVFHENEGLTKIFVSPAISKSDKQNLIENLFVKKMKVHPLLINYFQLIIKKYRETILLESLKYFLEQYNRNKGIQDAELISAEKLSDKSVDEIGKKLKQMYQLDFQFRKKIDPEILGGFVVRFEDKVVDASIRTTLDQLKEKLVAGEI